jgi:transcriptional regulator with XRE-family HTH domain
VISGDLLREARRRAGLSQAELARRAGKPTSVIGRWERNEVKPSLETLRELVAACGFELAFMLREASTEQDETIEQSLRLTPAQRLEQLEAAADLVLKGRRNLARV